jgi:hypothetical protein
MPTTVTGSSSRFIREPREMPLVLANFSLRIATRNAPSTASAFAKARPCDGHICKVPNRLGDTIDTITRDGSFTAASPLAVAVSPWVNAEIDMKAPEARPCSSKSK